MRVCMYGSPSRCPCFQEDFVQQSGRHLELHSTCLVEKVGIIKEILLNLFISKWNWWFINMKLSAESWRGWHLCYTLNTSFVVIIMIMNLPLQRKVQHQLSTRLKGHQTCTSWLNCWTKQTKKGNYYVIKQRTKLSSFFNRCFTHLKVITMVLCFYPHTDVC